MGYLLRIKLPPEGGSDSTIARTPGSLVSAADLGVGDTILGAGDDGTEYVYAVVDVHRSDEPALRDAVSRDLRSQELRITVGVGPYDWINGTTSATLTITARPVGAQRERADDR